MIQSNILETILEYRSEKKMPNLILLDALKFVWYLNKNNKILEEILDIKSANLDLPLYFKELDNIKNQFNNDKIEVPKKKGTGLNPYPLTWIYYGLYFALNLKEQKIEDFIDNRRIIAITKGILIFHLRYIKYKDMNEKNKVDALDSNLKLSARTIVRTIEYLIRFEQFKHEYLNEIYLDKEEVIIDFLEIASDEYSVERDYFLIKKNINKNKPNFFAYENTVKGINIHVESSKGINLGDQTDNYEQNNKISDYFAKGLEAYYKIIELEIKEKKGTYNQYSREKGGIQYTEEEELLANAYIIEGKTSTPLHIEDSHQVKSNLKVKVRAFPNHNLEHDIPNLYKQKLRNKAFSAVITKKSMLLTTNYSTPPIKVFREFLKYIFNDKLSEIPTIEDSYRVIFMLDAASGLGYKSIMELILKKEKIIRLNSNSITITLNKKLFAKNRNEFINKNRNKIEYKLADNFVYLINRIRSYYSELDDERLKLLLMQEEADKYYKYIKEKIKDYPKTIVFDPKSMWLLIDSYRKSLYYEDMSTLFCMGHNQQNDTPKLAYASTNYRAQNHSKLLEQLYLDLGLHELCANLLDFKKELFKPKVETNKSNIYVGSSQAVIPEKSRLFFSKLREIINSTTDEEKYFNLVSIYIRYSLSLLTGTRPYSKSASIDKCSMEMHLLMISEKADTLLSGIRVVPLCSQAEILIKEYKGVCDNHNVKSDNVYLIYQKKIKVFEKKIAIEILNQYEVDTYIVDFVTFVPLNTGRHVATKLAIEQNVNIHYIEAYLGHYMAGGEHQGIYSTLDMPDYISKIRTLTSSIARIYGVLPL